MLKYIEEVLGNIPKDWLNLTTHRLDIYDESLAKTQFLEQFENLFNGLHVPLEKILSYDYWTKLQNYLKGYDRSFSLCKSQCGKIISSIEKTEENLTTGKKVLFDSHSQNAQVREA